MTKQPEGSGDRAIMILALAVWACALPLVLLLLVSRLGLWTSAVITLVLLAGICGACWGSRLPRRPRAPVGADADRAP